MNKLIKFFPLIDPYNEIVYYFITNDIITLNIYEKFELRI